MKHRRRDLGDKSIPFLFKTAKMSHPICDFLQIKLYFHRKFVILHRIFRSTRHIETTKRYAKLAYGNVRNFQKELQGRYIGSRV